MSESTKQTENTAENGNKSKPMLQAVFLAPYLDYELQTNFGKLIGIRNWVGWCGTFKAEFGENNIPISAIKPHLKPLGDLTKDEKTCDEINEFLEPNGLEINNFLLLKNSLNAVAISWVEMQDVLKILYREHYDVFGLINKGLAISIHDVV